jgi:glycosyltransferase involved in cell wall biosynthesis
MADAMVALAVDPALRQRLGATGRMRFTEQFRHQNMTRRLREIYAEEISKAATK